MSEKKRRRGSGKTGRINKSGAGPPFAYKPEFVEQAAKLCALGATDMELADFFGVTWRTIYRWKNSYPKFAAAMQEGKDAADARVQRSLYQRAVGYDHDSVKIFLPRNSRKPVMVPYVEHVPPDITAGQYWLNNRRPDQWRNKNTVALGGDPDGTPVEVSGLAEFFSRIARLASAHGTASTDEPNDGSSSGGASK